VFFIVWKINLYKPFQDVLVVMGSLVYNQPFIWLTHLDRYPEVRGIIQTFYARASQDIQNNLYTIVCALLTAPKIAVSRAHEWYFDGGGPFWYTRHKAVRAQDLLLREGFVSMIKGRRAINGFENGFSSVVGRLPPLEDLLDGLELRATEVDSSSQAVLTLDGESLDEGDILKIDSEDLRSNGPLDTETLHSAYKTTKMLNERYFASLELDFRPESGFLTAQGIPFGVARRLAKERQTWDAQMASNVFFTSMFNLNGGGRLYQRCLSFQNIPRAMRSYLTINKSPTAESDYAGMHVNLAYFLCGERNPHLNDTHTVKSWSTFI